jgi:hypothetical protein
LTNLLPSSTVWAQRPSCDTMRNPRDDGKLYAMKALHHAHQAQRASNASDFPSHVAEHHNAKMGEAVALLHKKVGTGEAHLQLTAAKENSAIGKSLGEKDSNIVDENLRQSVIRADKNAQKQMDTVQKAAAGLPGKKDSPPLATMTTNPVVHDDVQNAAW